MYQEKVASTLAIIAIAVGICYFFINPWLALVVLALGICFIVNRHLARCEACKSWRTQVKTCNDESEPKAAGYDSYDGRCCSSCGNVQFVRVSGLSKLA